MDTESRMKRFLHSTLFILIVLAATWLSAGDELPDIKQMTTHPGQDFDPAISPDGKWMAFCSDRLGNLDIWIKPVPRGTAVQVTLHQADDAEPVWMPDSKGLIFVSKRRDAEGDLWSIQINDKGGTPKGKPKQLTDWLGYDGDPSVSPDGRQVVFSSRRSGQSELWILDLRSKRTTRLTLWGGSHPAWSPIDNRIVYTHIESDEGASLYLLRADGSEQLDSPAIPLTAGQFVDIEPAWSADGQSIIFQRYPYITKSNLNNALMFRSALWKKEVPSHIDNTDQETLTSSLEIQITGVLYHDQSPNCSSAGMLTFTSSRSGSLDIWSMPDCGLFPKMESAREQYSKVMDRFSTVITPEALHQAILGYGCVLNYFPSDLMMGARSLIRIADLYQLLEDNNQARVALHHILDSYSDQHREAAQALLKLASLKDTPLDERIAQCHEILMMYPDQEQALAEMHVLLGDLYLESGRIGESLNTYSQVTQPPTRVNWRAQAHLRIGDLFQKTDQKETARTSYYTVLREFGHIPIWRQRAIDRLLGQVEGSARRSTIAYQRIIQAAVEFPPLVAQAQLALCHILVEEGQYERALRELEEMAYLVPSEQWAQAEARILEAEVYSLMDDDLKGILRLEGAIQEYETLEGGIYAMKVRDTLFRILFESAESLRLNQDYDLAGARYRKALTLRSKDVACHRGLIECMSRTGRIHGQIQFYEENIQVEPEDPVLLYGLGLAYSYAGERNIDDLEQSNYFLMRALSEDYRMIYPYRALSFNYELMERLTVEATQKKPGFFKALGNRVVSPFKWVAEKLPFGEQEIKVGYYEKAIEVLITALELNDESQDPRMEALLAQNLANNYYNLGEFGFQKAFQYYQTRLELDSVFSNPLEKAVFHERAGHCGAVTGAGERAEYFLTTAIQIHQDLGRFRDVYRNEKMLAFHYQLNGQYEDAVILYDKLADVDDREGRWDELERDYRNSAYNFYLMGEPEDAIEYAKRAERILQTQKMPKGPPEKSYLRVGILGFSIPVWGMEEIGGASSGGFTLAEEAAFVYNLLSRCHEQIGDYDQALHYERKRRDIFFSRKDRLGERISQSRLGSLYFQKGYYETAWIRFGDARILCIKKEDSDGRWTNVVNLAHTAVVMMANENRDAHLDPALEILAKEEDLLTEEQASPDRHLAVQSLMGTLLFLKTKSISASSDTLEKTISQTLQRIAFAEEAMSYFQLALILAREIGDWKQESTLLKNLSEVSLIVGDRLTAYDYLRRSVRLLEKNGEESLLWRLKYSLANQLLTLSEADRALLNEKRTPSKLYREAISDLESLPVMEEAGQGQLSDRTDRMHLYEDGAIEYLRLGQIEGALTLIEKGKQKSLADILARRPPKLRRERHKIVWGNLRYVRTRIHEIRKQILEERSDKNRPSILQTARADLRRYQNEYAEILQDIQTEDEVLAYLSGAYPVNIKAARNHLDEDSGILYYSALGETIHLFDLDKDTVITRKLKFSRSELVNLKRGFLRAIESDSLTDLFSQYLYPGLIQPVEYFIESKSNLIIVQDNPTRQIPFCALSDAEGPMLDRWTISYAPSLTAYTLAASRRRISQNRSGVFGLASYSESKNPEAFSQESIPFPHSFKDELDTLDQVYLGGRFEMNVADPIHSIFQLKGEAGDSTLQLQNLFSMDIASSLLFFFHSDSSRVGDNFAPDLWCLSLLYAGVPTCGFSWWPPSQDAFQPFFEAFHAAIQTESYADALAEAQVSLMHQGRPMRDWAGIQLSGFEGMRLENRIQFAKENLVATVIKGRAFAERSEYPDAVMSLEEALGMARALDDNRSGNLLETEIIATSMQGGLWDKAIVYQSRHLDQAIQTEDRDGELQARNNLSVFYLRNGNPDEAVQMKQVVLDLIKESGSAEAQVKASEEMAFLFSQSGQCNQAAVWADTLLQLHQTVHDSAGMAHALLLLGRFQLEGERYWSARDVLLQAISIFETQIQPNRNILTNIAIEHASAYQLLGLVNEKLVRYEEAIDCQITALQKFQGLRQNPQIALARQYLANLYWEMGDYRRAIQFQREALSAFEKQKDQKLLAMAHSTLGLIQMSLGDLVTARGSELNAYQLAESSGSLADQATILKNMGLIAIQSGENQQAYNHLMQAARIDSTAGLQRGLAYDYRNLGQLLLRMDRIQEAELFLQKGLELSSLADDKRNMVQCHLAFGELFLLAHDYNRAMTHLDQAMFHAKGLVLPEIVWRIHRKRAAAWIGRQDYNKALIDYEEAVRIVEALRAELKVDALKQGFIDNKMDLYVDMVEHLVRMGRTEDAFHFVERAKSRSFIDMLGNQDVVLPKAEGELLEREKDARNRIQELQGKAASLTEREQLTAGEQSELDRLNLELIQARQSYQEALVEIQQTNPELVGFVSVDPIQASALQQQLPDSTAILEYYLTSGRLYIWMIRREGVQIRRSVVSVQQLESLVKSLREGIESHLSIFSETRALYDLLILPFEVEMAAVRHVVIVPHGILHYLPFATLQDESGRVLIDRVSLSLSPSATVLGYCLEKGETQRRKVRDISVLALGNPNLGSPRFDLPFAEKEVVSLERAFDEVSVYFHDEATEKNAKDHASEHEILHFACHATYEPESPLFSALLLKAGGQFEDGRLEAHEIFGLDLDCDLVALSACETGLAQITQGDEIIGLARSFIFAGASSIITSLWKVDDLATAVMVKRFYRYLSAGYSKAEALRKAQLVVKNSVNSHPSAWAAFGLTGDFKALH